MNNKSIERSENINEWAKAFAKFQARNIKAEKNAVNPHFRNKYANLESLVTAIGPHLSECGLCFTQLVSDGESGTSVTTMIIHESGQYVSETLTLKMQRNDMQGMGSAITYAKRYCLSAILGIPDSDGDDDGEAACQKPKEKLNKFVPPKKPTFEDKIKNMLVAYKGLNVTQEMIKDKLDKDVFKINSDDIAKLERWYLLVKKGEDFSQLE